VGLFADRTRFYLPRIDLSNASTAGRSGACGASLMKRSKAFAILSTRFT